MVKSFEALKTVFGNDDAIGQFIEILSLPDAKFDKIYPKFKETVSMVFSSNSFQKEILNQLQFVNVDSGDDLDSAKKAIDDLTKEVFNDESLSDNKKEIIKILIDNTISCVYELSQNRRERIGVKVKRINKDAIIPKYANPSDAGADIYAVEDTVINPNETIIVKTGIEVEIPAGYMIQIYSRSGLAAKTKLRIANSVGIIDTLYNQEIGVIIENTGSETYTIKKGDRIAQMLIMPTPMIEWEEVDEIKKSNRGGFGSTGK